MPHHIFTAQEIAKLIEDFEQLRLPRSSWTHLAHIIVASHYSLRSSESHALQLMRKRICTYNDAVGTINSEASGYHETLTRFWLQLIRKFIAFHQPGDTAAAVELMQSMDLTDRNLPLLFYSKNFLFSTQARMGWLPPDKLPLDHMDVLVDPATEPHFQLSDFEFENQLREGTLNPGLFSHEAHIRLAFIHLSKYGVADAITNIKNDIRNFAAKLGAAGKYNLTLTVAAIYVVQHFYQRSTQQSFYAFIHEFPQLKTDFRGLLASHYSVDIYQSELAKNEFLAPDLLPFS